MLFTHLALSALLSVMLPVIVVRIFCDLPVILFWLVFRKQLGFSSHTGQTILYLRYIGVSVLQTTTQTVQEVKKFESTTSNTFENKRAEVVCKSCMLNDRKSTVE